MKKKIYFILSAIIQIIIAFYVIINANAIGQQFVESAHELYATMPADFQERIINMYTSNGFALLAIPSVLSIIFNIIVIYVSINNTILRNKGKLIVFSVFGLLFGEMTISILLSLVNLIVLLCLKRKNPEDFPVKKEIPKPEEYIPTKLEKICGILLAIVYFLSVAIGFVNLKSLPNNALLIIAIVFPLTLFILAILAFKNRLKRDFMLLKNNFIAYANYVLPKLALVYVGFVVVNLACIIITKNATSVNQSTIQTLPIGLMALLAITWAPIVEEALFRGVLKRYISNRIAFIIASAIIFGLIHSILESDVFNVIFQALPYAVLGGGFAYIYSKTDNVTTNISCHMIWNVIATLLSSLAMFAL